ncbi:uncharacterized protein EI97DRAFT_145744 [Westerdykella ornata]|uniref:Uncharacterized protein n=1 Tax=Westerdykella ornata TaxID=318751 RepID=A0A6A6JF77_WESOR|nr:uncharacterized protein EI97DRAFT_145744 [Westerdykella ornata]KAF2273829.1 hypothetical protein EI97DRAFT_145744 [Westerdykella ornata]
MTNHKARATCPKHRFICAACRVSEATDARARSWLCCLMSVCGCGCCAMTVGCLGGGSVRARQCHDGQTQLEGIECDMVPRYDLSENKFVDLGIFKAEGTRLRCRMCGFLIASLVLCMHMSQACPMYPRYPSSNMHEHPDIDLILNTGSNLCASGKVESSANRSVFIQRCIFLVVSTCR